MKIVKISMGCLLFLSLNGIFAQNSIQKEKIDSATTLCWLDANFSYQLPSGELYKTFKPNFNLGPGITFKTTSNWTIHVRFNYLFGSSIRCDIKDILGNMVNANGDIIDGYGMKGTLGLEGRYWYLAGGAGKIIPVSQNKRNSGIWISADIGYFVHKIHFTDNDHLIDQLDGDYKKGYDQRSAGLCLSQFIGYLHIGKVRVASFYGGIEIYEMWTTATRNYNFVYGPTTNQKKFSSLLGFKLGWIIPLYEQKKTQTLYYR